MSGTPCSSDQECKDSPDGPVCDLDAGVCTRPCEPGEQEACYGGPDGTQDIGACVSGVRTCLDGGLGFGACEGAVWPTPEVCGNAIDDDCDGDADEDADEDGDGWGVCSGDCCDVASGACADPELVNPGAYEYVGNTVDDDCDGNTDEEAPSCDAALASDSADPLDYARALDLCQMTVENPPDPKDRTWGVIGGKFSLADGSGLPAAVSRSIRPGFGDKIAPQKHSRLMVLSSGNAADANDTKPPFVKFEGGANLGTTSPPPQDWWTAIGGKLPNPPGCNVPQVPSANDPIMLKLRIRVPTNAKSFSTKMYFFSAEYPEYVCSQYNDFFVALVDSDAEGNPDDKNVAIYDDGNTSWPIGVNLVKVAEGLFTQCQGGEVGCAAQGVPTSDYNGCKNTSELIGTGFDQNDFSTCDPAQTMIGGGTGWLTMTGNVSPGEVMEIRLAIWDTGGHIFDSVVLLDAWEWSLDPAEPGVTPG
ncbi:choice-of-anchor L domain-containing protein [Nannocystis sp. RBIL2]|uniref:choice-of-anchor L domain-containing protein n=1 Tax=Nannocystis sp. RBIL2 TaxID=2996788 RepID=UPI00226DF18E|nr:choice-of-anchor L domain-containing protein [Nannocystis sp. RBIL2]MCY1068348.1 choice-of-anchor L domain-containing protein [Nannocystis sp. RBIL2]